MYSKLSDGTFNYTAILKWNHAITCNFYIKCMIFSLHAIKTTLTDIIYLNIKFEKCGNKMHQMQVWIEYKSILVSKYAL